MSTEIFHVFISYGSSVMYNKYVSYPKNSKKCKFYGKEFDLAGMHGCIGSMDGVHVVMEKCEHR